MAYKLWDGMEASRSRKERNWLLFFSRLLAVWVSIVYDIVVEILNMNRW